MKLSSIFQIVKSLNLEYPPNNQPRRSEGQPGCFNSHSRRSSTGIGFARSAAAAASCDISGTVSSSWGGRGRRGRGRVVGGLRGVSVVSWCAGSCLTFRCRGWQTTAVWRRVVGGWGSSSGCCISGSRLRSSADFTADGFDRIGRSALVSVSVLFARRVILDVNLLDNHVKRTFFVVGRTARPRYIDVSYMWHKRRRKGTVLHTDNTRLIIRITTRPDSNSSCHGCLGIVIALHHSRCQSSNHDIINQPLQLFGCPVQSVLVERSLAVNCVERPTIVGCSISFAEVVWLSLIRFPPKPFLDKNSIRFVFRFRPVGCWCNIPSLSRPNHLIVGLSRRQSRRREQLS